MAEPGHGPRSSPEPPPLALLPAPEWAIGAEDDLATRESPLAPRRPASAQDGIDFGPTDRSRRRRRTAAMGVALAALSAAAVCGVVFVGTGGDATARHPARPADGARARRPHARSCPPSPAGPTADVDGDGCAEHVAVAGGTVTAGAARWSLGAPGDVVAVGDWDCRGGATPALLRPATGDLFVFSSWARRGRPLTVTPDRRIPGAVGLHAESVGGGCDLLQVDLPSGAITTIEVAR